MICNLCFGSPLEEFLRMASEVFVGEGEICVCWCLIKSIYELVSVNNFSSLSPFFQRVHLDVFLTKAKASVLHLF